MLVTSVSLRDFRNYERAEAAVGPSLTVVCGPNGAGKTNLIEGIHFALTGRSCRTRNEREVVRQGAKVARASVTAADQDGEHVFEVGFEPGEAKRATIDGVAAEPHGPGTRRPLASVFVPERLELVKGAPSARRGHFDQFTSALWPARAATRAEYGRALAQRNALIARIRAGAGGPTLLEPWNATLARVGIELMRDRAAAVEALAARFQERGEQLGLREPCALRYRPRSPADEPDALCAELADRAEDDIARGFTSHGPHRDEFVLTLAARSLRAFGSQGQQRTAVLALLLAERDVLADAGRPPLMLLDDVMSELDGGRRECLAAAIADGQAIVTATEPEQVPASAASRVEVLRVDAGALQPRPRLEAA